MVDGVSAVELGKKIASLRREKGMTLKTLSEKSEVSVSLLSMIERDMSVPTVRTLEKIALGLDKTVSSLFLEMENSERDRVPPEKVHVMHKRSRKKLEIGPERGNAHYELLTPDYQRELQFVYIHFPVRAKPGQFITHEGEECGLILEGTLKAIIGEQEFILEEGDSIYFDSSIPHLMENVGQIEVRAYWINTPPTF